MDTTQEPTTDAGTDHQPEGLVPADGVTPSAQDAPVVVTPPIPVNDPNADLEGGVPVLDAPPDAFPTAVTPLDDVTHVPYTPPVQPTPPADEPVSVTVVPDVNLLGQDMQTTAATDPAAAPVTTAAVVNAGWIHNELATLEAALSHGIEYAAGELRKLRQAVARKL